MTTTAEPDRQADCYCCGVTYNESQLVRLNCHSEIALCSGCVDWLAAQRRSLYRAVPVLASDDVTASASFWAAAGFEVESYGADFAVAMRDGVELHLAQPDPDGRNRGEAYLHAEDVDAVQSEWLAAGLALTEVRDEPWGMREFNVVDPGGNRIRVGRAV